MRFLHARLYRAELQSLVSAGSAGHAEPVEQLVTALCPRCTAAYFATYLGERPAGQEARRRARLTLDRECPDHPHTFTLPD
jgi:hypothetical protein